MPQLGSMFWRTYKRYSCSGQNNPASWGSFSQGDTLVDYLFALFKNHNLVMELVNPEIGAAGVEGDEALETGAGTRDMTTTRGKRKRDAADSAFQSLVDSSASMAASAAKHSRCAEMVSLSGTLKNLRDCGANPELIRLVEGQLEDIIRGKRTDDESVHVGARTGGGDLRQPPIFLGSDRVSRGGSESRDESEGGGGSPSATGSGRESGAADDRAGSLERNE